LELRSQKIELNPNNKQSTLLAQHCGYARVAYNAALSLFKDGLDKDQWRTFHDIKRLFNAKKYEIAPWSRGLSQNASKNAIHNFGDAVERWKSKQNRFPVFKNRSDRQSYQADNGLNTVKVCGKRIKLPKVGWIKMREELRFAGDIAKVVISRRDGRWFASILVHCDPSNYTHQSDFLAPQKPIGVDVGINTLATCSDGVKYDNPRPLKHHLRKLRRANRKLARRKFLSTNWQKQKRRLASIYYRIACIRIDAHHKASTDIVRRASAIGIETLNVSGMLKNKRIAKALSDSALGGFLVKVRYKAERHGIPVKQADMFFASSKTCSNCGDKKATLSLSERVFECDHCGFVCDRDVNAAINLCPTHIFQTVAYRHATV
jgi:putative transposase